MNQIRLAVGTRPALFREVLCGSLAAEKDFVVVGSGDAEDALTDIVTAEKPEVLLFDYEALGPNGESAILRLHRLSTATRILVMATRSGPATVEAVLQAGASGLVGKELGFALLARAVRAVAAGELWADRRTTAQVVERLASGSHNAGPPRARLTKRESDIVAGVLRGLRNKEIAVQMKISEKTVKSHLNSVFRKMGVESRFALALRAIEDLGLKT